MSRPSSSTGRPKNPATSAGAEKARPKKVQAQEGPAEAKAPKPRPAKTKAEKPEVKSGKTAAAPPPKTAVKKPAPKAGETVKGANQPPLARNLQCPADVEEAGAMVRAAAADLMSVVPAGRLSCLAGSRAVNRAVAVTISLRRLNKMVKVEPENLLAIVEAGITPAEVDEALLPTGLYWPVTGLGRRSLGAIMAEGALGAETMARGSMVDWVLGSSFITAEGKLVSSGGRTLKNVSGYDFTRLAWRSFGRLGLCAGFILKLLPRPAAAPVLKIAVSSAAEGAELTEKIILKKVRPEGLRIDCGPDGVSVLIWLAGFSEVVEARRGEIDELAGGRAVTVIEDGRAFWESREKRGVAFMGSRRAVLNLAHTLTRGGLAGIVSADLDVGGGKAYLELGQGVSRRGTALTVGLTLDEFTPAGEVYGRLKKGLDPEDLFFPSKLL